MSITLKWGSYDHGDGIASVAISKATIVDETGLRKRGMAHTWAIRGSIIAEGAAAIQTAKEALETAYATQEQDLILSEDGATRASILTAGCKGGTRITAGPDFADNREGDWATNLAYTITVVGNVFDGEAVDSEIIELEENTAYNVAQDGKTTVAVSGRLRTADGVSAKTKAESRDPRTVEDLDLTAYQRMNYNVAVNDEDDEATYSYTDREYWKALPSNVTGGNYTDQRTKTRINEQRVVRSGSFTGTGAQAGADNAKLTASKYKVVREQQRTNEYNGEVTFTYEYLDKDASDSTIFIEERTSLQASGTRFVLRPILNTGQVPVKQEICEVAARGTQSGSAVGMDSYPGFPAKRFDSAYYDKESSSEDAQAPLKGPGGDRWEYKISWNYVFNLPDCTTLPAPTVF